MKINLKALVLASITITIGVIVLLGYFVDFLTDLRLLIVHWAVLLSAVALLVGVWNMLTVHWNKMTGRHKGGVYSIFMLAGFFVTLLLGVLESFLPEQKPTMWVFEYIQIPIETSLLAILAVILVYGISRLLYRRRNFPVLAFFVTVLLMLVGSISFPILDVLGVPAVAAWLSQVWAVGGVRGILIGVALGATATGLRILLGSDRPYGG